MRRSIPASGHEDGTMSVASDTWVEEKAERPASIFALLLRDKFALASTIFLAIVLLCAVFGASLLVDPANAMNLRLRNSAPTFDHGVLYILGGDTLGRSILARIVVASRDTVTVSAGAVLLSALVGTALGLVAGLSRGWIGTVIMRLADVL